MRIYQIIEYTPKFVGYKLQPWNGMQAHYEMENQTRYLMAAKKSGDISTSFEREGVKRSRRVKFLGFAESVDAWNEKEQARAADEESRRITYSDAWREQLGAHFRAVCESAITLPIPNPRSVVPTSGRPLLLGDDGKKYSHTLRACRVDQSAINLAFQTMPPIGNAPYMYPAEKVGAA